MDLKLDWLAFTYKPDRDLYKKVLGYEVGLKSQFNDDVISNIDQMTDIDLFFLDFPEFEKIKDEFCILSGYSHYENILGYMGVSDTCRISYNTEGYSTVEMGVNVSIPSHGLSWFFELMGIDQEDEDAVSQLFTELKDRNCHCSRIDLAFDDYSKKFRPRQYVGWFYLSMLRTKFRKIQTAGSLHEVGHTFYLGDRKKKMLRVYDKDIESNGEIDAVRYEFELHQHHSRDMFEYLIENKTINFVEFLRTYFEVIDIEDSSNRSLCRLLPEWEQWLNELDFSEELPQKVDIPKYTLSQRNTDVTRWFYKSCVPSVRGFVACFGWTSLMEHVNSNNGKIPDKYRVLLELSQEDPGSHLGKKYTFDYDESDIRTYVNFSPADDVPDWQEV